MKPPAFARLCLRVLERGWLSSNNIVFGDGTVVDTGYVSHGAQTVALVEHALDGVPLRHIVNTHLHSDHCGGNAALQRRWPGVQARVPLPSLAAASTWDDAALTYTLTDQRCERFAVSGALRPGVTVALGGAPWRVIAAPGHDPESIILWQADERVLISADALWRDGLGILFPELDGAAGFAPASRVLDDIEALDPAWVIPGHGAPFDDVADALARARSRLARFSAEPLRHRDYAARALVMFHMLEHQRSSRAALLAWMQGVPLFHQMAPDAALRSDWAANVVERLVASGALRHHADDLSVA